MNYLSWQCIYSWISLDLSFSNSTIQHASLRSYLSGLTPTDFFLPSKLKTTQKRKGIIFLITNNITDKSSLECAVTQIIWGVLAKLEETMVITYQYRQSYIWKWQTWIVSRYVLKMFLRLVKIFMNIFFISRYLRLLFGERRKHETK